MEKRQGFALLSLEGTELGEQQSLQEVLACNEQLSRFGLAFTAQQAAALVTVRGESLRTTGRLEFSGGTLKRLIRAFSDSVYLPSQSFDEILEELVQLFYLFKNETMDRVTDEELLSFMTDAFNGPCRGSVDLLGERELSWFAARIRRGDSVEAIRSELLPAPSLVMEEDDEVGEWNAEDGTGDMDHWEWDGQ